MPAERVIIIMGSEGDLDHSKKIARVLDKFDVQSDLRVASAHKSLEHLLNLMDQAETKGEKVIYIAVAGRSNALGGVIDANTSFPVINAPPYSEKYSGLDILSSLRMPSGISAVTVIEPEAAALHAIKILALNNPDLENKYRKFQEENIKKILDADKDIKLK